MNYKIKNIELCTSGEMKIELAMKEMPGLGSLIDLYRNKDKPLLGARIAGCLHMTVETAVLIHTLQALGADVRWCSSNRYSTCDKAAAAMVARGIPIFAWYGESEEDFKWCMDQVLFGEDSWRPNMILDDGAELTSHICLNYPSLLDGIRGISEETTSGLFELRKLEIKGLLSRPAIVVNNSITKSKFDNIYGCHESLIHAIKNSTGLLVSGKVVTVVGYGEVGKGCTKALRGFGARVQVVEVDPISGLQAAMDGYNVVTMDNACKNSHLFITATGNKHVISYNHMLSMLDGTILCNMGNFNNEIEIEALDKYPSKKASETLEQYTLKDNKRIFLMGFGAPANLACAGGHSSFVMSTSFANQVMAQLELWSKYSEYEATIHTLPRILDEQVARLHLDHLGVQLSFLTPEQADYIGVNKSGPFKLDFYRY
ncbi:adenosylhomocysteinase [Xenorhabdus bovienii]|uniref:adenosylhomocysteinase n=3 Tax=Xenorhabdus bovienii TaxID=40576 RepID=UPI00237CBE2B|nr:adenosylhomocysteinase [Xenorhabdus bovienii]MDE1473793.1 adenosylhomocysteinase [Xenorhabdus bovienii]MDE1481809.1 adenosylhomocysteinase [Xenorhabdus bovienii]MDE9427889.1 adenosylhomocysteinase [Xenorhabdus bovienii]MDE9431516.1 adenosylhomocysteinase [Xenorhabdus bovienii]MDE9440635.1 adenosylhomocysteinase [Xenorhabdus bovienii]